ncbi:MULTISPECIES: hypothetical protein [unclassified Bacillus (in: firmicutes)]|uniref:hypothetical protein n=1 Tax=unclassified Bacillus (in: firmicutes) TaxID=185979 RepID=UPI001BE77F9E|nr:MULTISPECIES: hypothetical protein [unclassified Bacillus (in: firmicutes)]MBT2616030.1 hypothetical protein [Bacillus sp. ISL-78]MBT2630218.1 hypothetical protein [Bacillus sp. ISL-101]MBT2714618.1 hypothetical protein [Bacillus sp. ISL-57]
MKKKSLFSILIISLLVFSHVPNTLAEEKKETIPSATVNPIVEVKLISDDVILIQPTASIIEMSKPIAHQAKLTNTQLGKMVKAHQKGTTWLSIVSTLVFAGDPTAPAGVATALASALAGSPNSLIAAYYSGKHAYHVSVYASGKKPSLSKITYIYYTKSILSFRSPR